MPNRVRTLVLSDEQRRQLQRRVRARGSPARVVERARIVLLAGDGLPGLEIAERGGGGVRGVGLPGPRVGRGVTHWSSRRLAARLRRGGRGISPATVARIW